jgi:hypothetical protein
MTMQFFCLQPIKLSKNIFFNIHQKKYTPNKKIWVDITDNFELKELDTQNIPLKWFSEISSIKRHKIYVNKSNFTKFNSDLVNLNKSDMFNTDSSINEAESGYVLCYDYDYKVFFIIYCFSLNVSNTADENQLTKLYQKIRNQLVVDTVNGNIEISDWANSIRSFAIKEIANEFKSIANIKEIQILENSGYICSLFSEFDKLNIEGELSLYKENFLHNNHNIDLIDEKKYEYAHLSINKGVCKGLYSNGNNVSDEVLFNECNSMVFLGWRFTTLYGIKEGKDIKLLSLFINIQNIYFQIDNFYKPYLSELYEEVRYTDDYVSLSENLILFDKLVVSFQNLVYEKERFISELKPFQTEVFSSIEEYWGLTNDYKNIEKTLDICQTSLERKLNIKNNNIQQKQSDILFVLAIIQIFSIISIVGDYFSLFGMDNIDKQHKLAYSTSKEYILYTLVVSSTLLIFFAYIERIWYFIKKNFKKIFYS